MHHGIEVNTGSEKAILITIDYTMGIFDFLFDKPVKLDYEFFGSMLFFEDKKRPT